MSVLFYWLDLHGPVTLMQPLHGSNAQLHPLPPSLITACMLLTICVVLSLLCLRSVLPWTL